MASLFENAVSSIRMGVEDFRQQDEDRDISAVRNLYAGILLLAKELLIRTVPDADPMHVISANLKPIPDGSGGIEFEKSTKRTVDFEDIIKRFKDFDLSIDKTALRELNGIRNDMEHHFSDQPANAIRSAISKVFPVAASLFRQMDEDPLRLLGDEWAAMLETKELYDQELKEAQETLCKINWHSISMDGAKLKCLGCASELVEQIDPENENQNALELRCKTCGATPELSDTIEATLEDIYHIDAYIRAKEGMDDGPIVTCPACDRDCLIEGEESCANCGEELDYENECNRCGEGISIQDYLDGLDGGLCSYCNYVTEKAMRE